MKKILQLNQQSKETLLVTAIMATIATLCMMF
jgi:hypothetical protein